MILGVSYYGKVETHGKLDIRKGKRKWQSSMVQNLNLRQYGGSKG